MHTNAKERWSIFQLSLTYKLRYTKLISDSNSKIHFLRSSYSDHLVVCVGHVQKRMGIALRNLKTPYKGQKSLQMGRQLEEPKD